MRQCLHRSSSQTDLCAQVDWPWWVIAPHKSPCKHSLLIPCKHPEEQALFPSYRFYFPWGNEGGCSSSVWGTQHPLSLTARRTISWQGWAVDYLYSQTGKCGDLTSEEHSRANHWVKSQETSQITVNDSCSARNKVLHGHGLKPTVVHAGRHLRQMYSISLPGISSFCSPNPCCGNPR